MTPISFPYSWFTIWLKLFGHDAATNVFMQRWIGKGVAREHVHWMGGTLAQLTPEQIRDAFRAAHYSPAEVELFGKAVEQRIARLKEI